MHTKLKIVNGLLVLALAYDFRISRRNRAKHERLLEENTHLQNQFDHVRFIAEYLSTKLYQHEIILDEFDLIALNNPID